MAQHDYSIANQSGASFRSDLNNALSAIVSQNSGTAEPSTTYAYQMWADTTNGVMKLRNAANNAWITLYQLDGEWSVIPFENGSAAAPSIYFKDSGTDTGFFSAGTDQVNVTTGGTERVEWGTSEVVFNDVGGNYDFRVEGDTNANLLFVDASADAVGIGTSSPSTLLHVAGSGSETTTTQTPVSIYATTSSTAANGFGPTLEFGAEASDGSNYAQTTIRSLWTDATAATRSSALTFSTRTGAGAVTERLRIDDQGRVGIGTTSPVDTLHVVGAARFGDGTNFAGISASASGAAFEVAAGSANLLFKTGGSERARIDSSGRLLVGTSSSAGFGGKLQGRDDDGLNCEFFRSNATSSGPTFALNKSRGSAGSPTIVSSGDILSYITGKGYDGSAYQEAASVKVEVDGTPGANDMPGRLVFSTTADGASSPTERVRITNAGRFNVVSTEAGVFSETTQSAGTTYVVFQGRHSATAGSALSGTTSFQVFSNGNVQNTNNSYAGISDVKLKENIVDAASQWSDVKALQVRKYNFKEGQTHTQIGLIAQEVELVSPGLVTESPDRDEDGNDLGTVTKSVNYSVLYMKAVKALQEAMERIEQLEAKVSVLESKP